MVCTTRGSTLSIRRTYHIFFSCQGQTTTAFLIFHRLMQYAISLCLFLSLQNNLSSISDVKCLIFSLRIRASDLMAGRVCTYNTSSNNHFCIESSYVTPACSENHAYLGRKWTFWDQQFCVILLGFYTPTILQNSTPYL